MSTLKLRGEVTCTRSHNCEDTEFITEAGVMLQVFNNWHSMTTGQSEETSALQTWHGIPMNISSHEADCNPWCRGAPWGSQCTWGKNEEAPCRVRQFGRRPESWPQHQGVENMISRQEVISLRPLSTVWSRRQIPEAWPRVWVQSGGGTWPGKSK